MIVAGIFLYLISGFTTTSANIFGVVIGRNDEFWLNNMFLKFYSPSGKNYYINYRSGGIALETTDVTDADAEIQNVNEDVKSPYIRFVSIDLKIYDIYFEIQGLNYDAHIVETKLVNEDRTAFIRHRLHSFVGPNNQIYKLSYNNNSDISIALEVPAKSLDHLQIKTLGAYSKWEHTYDFSKNGDLVTNVSLSPVNTFPIQLPEMEPDLIKDRHLLMMNFSTPIGNKYLITNDLNIASVHREDDVKNTNEPSIISSLISVYSFFSTAVYGEDKGNSNEPYISFMEPDGGTYDVYFHNDDQPQISGMEVKDEDQHNNNFLSRDIRLFSFVGPNKRLYLINRTNESGHLIPTIDSSSSQSSDVQITIIETNNYYKKYMKFIFSGDGRELSDIVDEIDSTPLSEQPGLQLDEVEDNSKFAMSSFLTFYSPSGKNYYISPNDTKADIAIQKGSKNSQPSYITFRLNDGRKCKIYLKPGGVPSLEIDSTASTNSTTPFYLRSFVTPDKKLYKIGTTLENDILMTFIDFNSPKDPFDEILEETLKITVASSSREYFYHFTWTGDKLVKANSIYLRRIAAGVLKSLVG